MVSDSESEVDATDWGRAKFDYYYTDYIDHDYPNINAKESRLAAIEQEEALKIHKRLLSTLDGANLTSVFEEDEPSDLLTTIENQNRSIEQQGTKRKKVTFAKTTKAAGRKDGRSDHQQEEDDDYEQEDDEGQDDGEEEEGQTETRKRRPINIAMKKNRGLTPYKKKEYRNPRVKHKLKYNKALIKRRRIVKEAQTEFHRYSGEATGIKTSTIRSVKLC